MKRNKYNLMIIEVFILVTLVLMSLTACTKQENLEEVKIEEKQTPLYDAYEKLVMNLKDMGYTIEAEDVEESILLGERKWLTINESDNISVYIYESNKKMEKDASYISNDGFSYDNGREAIMIDWVSYPHFFKSEDMIVLYVGDNLDIIDSLEELIGPQFAGDKDENRISILFMGV